MRRSVPILFAACVFGIALPVAAQDEEQVRVLAQELFDDAERLLSANRAAEACPKYAESYRLDPHLGVLIYLAECYEQNGQLASAWGAFREAEGMAIARNDERLAHAHERVEALTPRLSRLTVSVPTESRAQGMTLYRNGLELPPAAWGTATPTDAGRYVLEAKAPGRQPWKTSVVVPLEGGNVRVTVPHLERDLLPLPTEPSPPVAKKPPGAPPKSSPERRAAPPARTAIPAKPADKSGQSQKITALAVGGLGVVGLGLGGGLALSAHALFDDSKPLCNKDNVCTSEGAALRDSAESKAMVATVVTSVGAAAIVGGLVLWLVTPTAHEPPPDETAWSLVPTTTGWGLGAHRAF
jgi:hypothetical protein